MPQAAKASSPSSPAPAALSLTAEARQYCLELMAAELFRAVAVRAVRLLAEGLSPDEALAASWRTYAPDIRRVTAAASVNPVPSPVEEPSQRTG